MEEKKIIKEFCEYIQEPELYGFVDEFLANRDKGNKIPFEAFWDNYGKKVGRKETEAFWNKMSGAKQEKALSVIPSFLSAFPDPKYRVDPIRYLRKERYNDDLSTPTEKPAIKTTTTPIDLF